MKSTLGGALATGKATGSFDLGASIPLEKEGVPFRLGIGDMWDSLSMRDKSIRVPRWLT